MSHPSGPSLLFDLFVVGSRLRTLLGAAMVDSPLTPDEYAVYSTLVDAGPSTPSRMASLTGMPPTTMSRYVRLLIDRGHAERSRNRADGRSVVLRLTAAGSATHRAAASRFEEANSRFLAALAVEEDAARTLLHAIADAAGVATDRLAADAVAAAG